MANVSCGSITIVDLTDLGEFSVYPMSNLPLTITNNPNTNIYTPNWADNNLTISPVCYYAGQSVTPSSVTWTVQKNAGSATDISSSNGELMSETNLVVSKNRFADDTSIDMLTYYVTAKYIEPDSKIELTAVGQITYTLIKQATNGEDAVIHELYVNGKDIIDKNGTTSNDVVITSRLIKGASEMTSGVTRTWWKYNSSSTNADKYDEITTSANSTTLTVTGDMVDGFASFKCIANGHTAYYCVRDYSDPLQVNIMSTIGDKILNGIGVGAVYAVVHQNGIELDPIPEVVTSTSQATGSECYVIANKKVTYYKNINGAWATATPTLVCSYEWTFRDKDGNSTSFNGYSDSTPATGQIIYVDGDLFANKITIDLKVTK